MSFDIPVKNSLLEKKHFDALGKAIWLYMLLLDKVTAIDENGLGKVLGGKPLTFEKDIAPVFAISRQTYSKWVEQLESYPYVEATRTPHGISFKVYKAHKYFGERRKENFTSQMSRKAYDPVKKTLHGSKENRTSIYRQYNDNTKTMGKYVEKQETRSTTSEAKERIRQLLKTGDLKKLKGATNG